MSLERDRVTVWQRDTLAGIAAARAAVKEGGAGVDVPGVPNAEYDRTIGDRVFDNRSGTYTPGSTPGGDYDRSVTPFVEDNRSQPLPPTSFRPHGTAWMSHLGDTFGLSVPVPGTGMSLGFGTPDQMLDNAKRAAAGLATDFLFGQIFRGDEIERVEDRVNQELENRGFLEFQGYSAPGHWSHSNADGGKFLIPFFENPKIQESRSSRYSSHDIVNRNEPWRLFTGADAKKLRLQISMTLPHIFHFAIASAKHNALEYLNHSEYFEDFKRVLNAWNTKEGYQSLSVKTSNNEQQDSHTWAPMAPTKHDAIASPGSAYGITKDKLFLGYIQYMIDKIRASVLGSVTTAATLGAPLVFLNYGTLYQDEAFIVRNYSMSFDGDSGYDTNSLLPRRFNISLSLEGFNQHNYGRTGDGSNRQFPYIDPSEGWDTILRTFKGSRQNYWAPEGVSPGR